jgi:arylsulfatase A-like enzyme
VRWCVLHWRTSIRLNPSFFSRLSRGAGVALLAFACAVAAVNFVPAAAASAPRPDILLIMPDQFRGDSLSMLGHPVVRTPTLDALVKEGALFRRAYSTVPSCIPARFALLTGLAPQTSGVVGYAPRKITTPTLPDCLVKSGYATVLVGRNMHQSPDSGSLGYQQQILGSTYVANDDYDRELKQAQPATGGIRQLIETLGVDTNRWPAKAWPLAEELHPTNWTVRRSREVIAHTPATQPLFLTASFYAPHPPFFPPARFFDRYLKADLPPVAMGDWVDQAALTPEGDKPGHRIRLEGDTLRRAQAGYYGLIEHLDEQLAPLIADFKARSEKAGRPWLIVVTSDHGESLGDHGFFRKCEPYEGSANIPFIVAGSSALGFAAGTRSMQPVCNEDLMPTLLALAGTDAPGRLDGRDLAPNLHGNDLQVRPWLHLEHSPIYGPQQGFHALTDGRFKYIWRPHSGREQLFDLTADPREEHDLAPDPAQRKTLEHWRGVLIERLAKRPEGFSDGARLIAGRPYRALLPLPKS